MPIVKPVSPKPSNLSHPRHPFIRRIISKSHIPTRPFLSFPPPHGTKKKYGVRWYRRHGIHPPTYPHRTRARAFRPQSGHKPTAHASPYAPSSGCNCTYRSLHQRCSYGSTTLNSPPSTLQNSLPREGRGAATGKVERFLENTVLCVQSSPAL